MDVLGLAQALLGELLRAVEGAQCNKGQCGELGRQAQRLVSELERLGKPMRQALMERGVFAELAETLRAAKEFCEEFAGKHFLRRMLSHAGDAAKFAEFKERLDGIVQAAQLSLALDQRAWHEAQQKDASVVEAILKRMEQGMAHGFEGSCM
jgi:hypothetical protein